MVNFQKVTRGDVAYGMVMLNRLLSHWQIAHARTLARVKSNKEQATRDLLNVDLNEGLQGLSRQVKNRFRVQTQHLPWYYPTLLRKNQLGVTTTSILGVDRWNIRVVVGK